MLQEFLPHADPCIGNRAFIDCDPIDRFRITRHGSDRSARPVILDTVAIDIKKYLPQMYRTSIKKWIQRSLFIWPELHLNSSVHGPLLHDDYDFIHQFGKI